MPFDMNALPVSGGIVVAGLLWVGTSLFVTGPLIGDRIIEKKVNWSSQCAGHIRAEIAADEPEPAAIPKFGCNAIFGFYGRAGADYCRVHGHLFDNNILTEALDATQNAKRAAHRKRMEYAVSRAGSRCACAATTTLERRRTDFALVAGTLRLVVPRSVKSVESELKSALNSPRCAAKG